MNGLTELRHLLRSLISEVQTPGPNDRRSELLPTGRLAITWHVCTCTHTMIKCKIFNTLEIVKFSEINDRIQTTDKMTKFKNVSKEIIQSEEL